MGGNFARTNGLQLISRSALKTNHFHTATLSMKRSLLTLLAATAAGGGISFSQTATTTPVGYVTQTLSPNMYNLVSVTMHNPVVYSGLVQGKNSTSISFTGVDFTSLLQTGSIYILELPDGTIQEISGWTTTSLNTPQDISGAITINNTVCKLRRASTVKDIFGANNTFGLQSDGDENLNNNDLILVPNANNSLDTVYYYDDGDVSGWFDRQGNEANNKVLNYGDGFFVQRRVGGAPIQLTVVGEVKSSPTSSVIVSGYNYMGSVAPAGIALKNSGLKNFLAQATSEESIASADLVLQQRSNGTYNTVYYYNDGETTGWFDYQGNQADDLILNSGYLIFNKGSVKSVTAANQ